MIEYHRISRSPRCLRDGAHRFERRHGTRFLCRILATAILAQLAVAPAWSQEPIHTTQRALPPCPPDASHHTNSPLIYRCETKDGTLHGPYLAWHPNHMTREMGWYVYGKKEGPWETWYETGVRESRVEYQQDKRTGLFERWHPSGQLAEQGSYKADGKHGVWQTWHETGQLESRIEYQEDGSRGRYETWYSNGNPNELVTNFDNPNREETQWNKHGVIIRKGHYQDGSKHGPWIEINPEGAVEHGTYDKGWKAGTWTTYYPNGTKRTEGVYSQGSRNGLWQEWYPDGRVKVRGQYEQDVREGQWVEYHADGSEARRGEYQGNKKQGLWIKRAPNGAEHTERYLSGYLFRPHSWQFHIGGGFGWVFGGHDVRMLDMALVRSHRRFDAAPMYGYGLHVAGSWTTEAAPMDDFLLHVGAILRVGLESLGHRQHFFQGGYVYLQAEPYLRFRSTSEISSGVRMATGVTWTSIPLVYYFERANSPYGQDDIYKTMLVLPVLLALTLIDHVEVGYRYDDDRTQSIELMLGFGF